MCVAATDYSYSDSEQGSSRHKTGGHQSAASHRRRAFQVDHLCRIMLCQRPHHLELLTKRANVKRRGSTRSRTPADTTETPKAAHRVSVALFGGVEPTSNRANASCVDVCPVSCIYEAPDMYYINPDECIECGACEPECPVNAIFHESAVPDEWTSYTQKNRELSGL